jgi:membrane-associated phospholipid phosphatase
MQTSLMPRTTDRRAAKGRSLVTLTLGVSLLSACSGPSPKPDTGPSPSEGVTETCATGGTVAWNQIARDLVVKHKTGAAPAVRVYALVSVAQYNAVVAAEEGKSGSLYPSGRAALAGASAAVLAHLYPAEVDHLESRVQEQAVTCAGSRSTDFASGDQIGRSVAAAVITRAMGDGFSAPFTGTVPACPGCWRPVPTPPAFATLGQAKTFFLTSGDQFRPPPPPPVDSPAFLADLTEVRGISDTRTAAQEEIAKRWSLQGGTVTPLGHWNVVASDLIVRNRLSERRAAHVLALMNVAGYDALVASHEAKYTYWLLRPTQADPAITMPIALPSFPSYPSNHAALSAVAATVLGSVFPPERTTLDAAAEEAGVSRIYGGIHYRFDSVAGLALGRAIAGFVLAQDVGRGPLPLK